jgi:iron(III) transport system substrate-binding protein
MTWQSRISTTEETKMTIDRRQFALIGGVALAALMAAPALAQSGRVVLYNPGGAALADALVTAFNAKHPEITVDVINGGVGELFTRIEAEGSRPNGDVLLGASVEAFEDNLQFFEPYVTADDAAYPREFVGPDNLYYGLDLLLQTFMVNTQVVAEADAPKSWTDLADPQYAGKIVMANPSLSGSAYGQFAQILQLHGWELAEKVVANVTFLSSSQLVWQGVRAGEYGVGVTGDNNVVSGAAAGFPVVAVYPEEGTALRFSANALIKGGPNPDNGKLLLDFINSAEFHTISVELSNRRSVRPDVAPPAGQKPFSEIPTFEYDDAAAAAGREENLKRFDEQLARK